MLRDILKEQTHSAHQKTEGIIIRKIKGIRSQADYIEVLKGFYAYFYSLEEVMKKHITQEVLPDLKDRRNSSYIQKDIEALGGNLENLPKAVTPEISNTIDALSAMYVLEGSIMGGPYIVKMLEKQGIDNGFSFFQGYGSESGKMFSKFAVILNAHGEDPSTHARAVKVADQTFKNFGEVFTSSALVNS